MVMMKIRHSEFVMKYNAMSVYSEEQMKQQIDRDIQNENTWYMELKENHQMIGAIYLHQDSLRYNTQTVELSYWLSEEMSHQGYMSEALERIIQVQFEKKIKGITARCFKDNIASKKLLTKLGFVHEGTLKNAVKGYHDKIYDDELYYLENKK